MYVHACTVEESPVTAGSVATVATCAAAAPDGVDQVRCSARFEVPDVIEISCPEVYPNVSTRAFASVIDVIAYWQVAVGHSSG